MTATEASNCQSCGHSPAAWAEGSLILIQCIQPTCASIAIIGGHTFEMATKAWDAYQATNKDKKELRDTNRALLEQLDEERARATGFALEMAGAHAAINAADKQILELTGEVKRLTEALAASNADRDRLAQQLGMAQTEARGLRIELNRVSAPHAGYPYGDALE